MASGLLIFPGAQPSRSRSGGIISAELRFYVNETTTPAVVYTDQALTVPHTWPILSDDAGRFSLIWADTADFFSCNWSTAAPDSQSISFDGLSTTNAADVQLLDSMNAVLSDAMDLYEDFAAVEQAVDDAQGFAAQAAASASGAPGANSTSTTSLAIGPSTKALTVETNKLYVPGQTVAIASTASPNNQMSGIVQTYSIASGALVVDVTSTSGSGTFAAWTVSLSVLASQLPFVRSARSSDQVLGTTDNGAFIDVTSGTFSQTFQTAAALGSGWRIVYRNGGTGDITLLPGGVNTIDGRASFIMYPGEVRIISSDGGDLRTVVLQGFSKTFTASGTFVKPPGYSKFGFRGWGGGGGGGNNATGGGASVPGGGGGACWEAQLEANTLAASETVTVGAGGLGQTVDGPASAGEATTLGSLLSIPGATSDGTGGGVGGTSSTPQYLHGAPCVNTPVNAVYGGSASSLNGSVSSSNTIFGGAAGGSIGIGNAVRSPGASTYGGQGGAASIAGSGVAGTAPGGGGGATQDGATSGAGARGEFRLWGAV